jgi:ketosteroid isomerase-like protein
MSTQQNVDIVKGFLAALGRRDKQGLLALSAENTKWIIPGEDWPLAGTYQGHTGLEKFTSESQRNGGNFLPRASGVHSPGKPGCGHRLRYREDQSHE